MKLVVLCLFAVCCWSLANTTTTEGPTRGQTRKLQEVLRQLNDVRESLQNDTMLNAPPENIEDCCSLTALECFRSSLQAHFVTTQKKMSKLIKSLRNSLTVNALNFCTQGNVEPTCSECGSDGEVNVQEFFNRLKSFIQEGITRLNN
ncbi:interleukin-21 isoform X2 [Xiphias gladius]|uniref:interleukin-21 isoform X2 n=1 Tax=Xiphias gladius TaxID=8245 RepID=UPI001A97D6C5|nr:interleukin-21 isoform X2 [Xiphias gladius]